MTPIASSAGSRALPHRHLPRIELAPIAAHRHQHQERQLTGLHQGQHVDAIADAAALDQEHAFLAAEPGAGEERDPLLLGGQRHDPLLGIGFAEPNQPAVAGIGHDGDLPDVKLGKDGENGL